MAVAAPKTRTTTIATTSTTTTTENSKNHNYNNFARRWPDTNYVFFNQQLRTSEVHIACKQQHKQQQQQ